MGKRKKRVTAAGKDPKRLQGEKRDKKLVPLAKKLIVTAVILVAASQLLRGKISAPVTDAMILAGGILAIGALICQLRGQNRKL